MTRAIVLVRTRTLLPRLLLLLLAPGCAQTPDRLVLATTSSAYDTGLLAHLTAAWHAHEGPPALHVLVTGSGEALALGARGDADVLLVHAPESERAWLDAGHGILRLPVMRNEFVVVGPVADPAGVSTADDLLDAFRRIHESGTFVSRADDSGTHQRELRIRAAAGLPRPGSRRGNYVQAGQGMAETLRMTAELRAYTLSDAATLGVWHDRVELRSFAFADTLLDNPYSVIVPSKARDTAGAARFARWLAGPAGQALIADFRAAGAGPMFSPAAAAPAAAR